MKENLRRWIGTAVGVFGLLVGGAAVAHQTPTPPQSPSAPQAPTPPQAPTAPQSPSTPQAPTPPQSPSLPQAPTPPQSPSPPQAPTAPQPALPPAGRYYLLRPNTPISGGTAPTPIGGAPRPGLFPRTNVPLLGGQFPSNMLARSNNLETALPGALVIRGGPATDVRQRSGYRYLWLLYFGALFGGGFYLVKKIYKEKDAGSATIADGRPRP